MPYQAPPRPAGMIAPRMPGRDRDPRGNSSAVAAMWKKKADHSFLNTKPRRSHRTGSSRSHSPAPSEVGQMRSFVDYGHPTSPRFALGDMQHSAVHSSSHADLSLVGYNPRDRSFHETGSQVGLARKSPPQSPALNSMAMNSMNVPLRVPGGSGVSNSSNSPRFQHNTPPLQPVGSMNSMHHSSRVTNMQQNTVNINIMSSGNPAADA